MEDYFLKQQTLLNRFYLLSETVKKVTDGIGTLKKATTTPVILDEKSEIEAHLPGLTSSLRLLIEQAKTPKEEAQTAKLKSLGKNVHALSQALHSAQNKLSTFLKAN